MTDTGCSRVGEAATEYAFGVLPAEQARDVSAHVLACPACRREVEDIRAIGDRLLDLLPDAEPPLGFDRRVLSAVGGAPGRRRSRTRLALGAAAAAAALAGAGTAAATFTGGHRGAPARELVGVFRQGGSTVGTVYLGGHPAWVYMTVTHLPLTGTVSCELVGADGEVATVGRFPLVAGSGSWGAAEGPGISHPIEARLVAPSGDVLARAALAVEGR